jgi:L-lactate utilization protein LutC
MDEIRSLIAAPQVVVGSVAAVTETGSLLAASATGSQIPAFAGGAAHRIWVVGAQKVVPDLETALRRIETYAYPLEDRRARAVYGSPSAISEVLIVNGDPFPGRTRVLLLHQAIGY